MPIFLSQLSTFSKQQWFYSFLTGLLLLDFLLLHSNQRSSQTLASILLFLGPCVVFLPSAHEIFKSPKVKWLVFFVALYCSYNFFIFTSFKISQVSFGKFRDLMFWLVLPIGLVIFYHQKLSYKTIFLFFSLAAVFSLVPVISDLIKGGERGMSSAQPMYWGNIALSTGLITFVLSRLWVSGIYKYLGYAALFFAVLASSWSETRGGWISVPISIGLLLYFKVINWRHVFLSVFVFFVALSFSPRAQIRIKQSIAHFTAADFHVVNDAAEVRSSTQQRIDMWRFAVTHMPNNTLVGGGLAFFKETVDRRYRDTGLHQAIKQNKNVHNEYLEVLISRGGIGLIFFLAMIFCAVTLLKKESEDDSMHLVRVAGYLLVVQYAVFALTAIFFSAKYPVVYFCLVFSLLGGFYLRHSHGVLDSAD